MTCGFIPQTLPGTQTVFELVFTYIMFHLHEYNMELWPKLLLKTFIPCFYLLLMVRCLIPPAKQSKTHHQNINLKTFFQNSYSNYSPCLTLCIFQEGTQTGTVNSLLCAVPAQSSTSSVTWKELILVSMVSEQKCGYMRIR